MGSQARPSSIPRGEAENITDCIVQHNGCFTAQWVLYTSSWCEDAHVSCTLHISCPLTECKYWSGTSLLPWSSKHREKWSPGTILYKWQSYLPSCYYQIPSVTWSVNKKYWQKTYVCGLESDPAGLWFYLLFSLCPAQYLWCQGWADFSPPCSLPVPAVAPSPTSQWEHQIIRCLQGCKVPHSRLLSF